MAATYTGTGGIFTLLGKEAAWFYQLDRILDGTSFSATSGGVAYRFKSIDRHDQEIASAMANVSQVVRDQRAAVGRSVSALKRVVKAQKNKVRDRIDGLLKTHAKNDADIKEASADRIAFELARQMSADSATVKKNSCTVSAVSAHGQNVGNGSLYVYAKDISGTVNEEILADNFVAEVLTDSINDGATAGQESIQIRSEAQEDELPAISTKIAPIHVEGTDNNRLSNASFESATTSVATKPASWNLDTGSADMSLVSATADVYLGSKAFQISADGATATYKISQTIGALSTKVKGGVMYHLGFVAKGDWTAGAATAHVSLTGTGYSTTGAAVQVSAPSSTYQKYSVFIPVPRDYPSDLEVVVRLTGTVVAGKKLHLDNFSFGEADKIGGVYVAAVRGSTEWRKKDRLYYSSTNDYGGIFQSYFTRDHKRWRQRLPSSGSPSIANSLAE